MNLHGTSCAARAVRFTTRPFAATFVCGWSPAMEHATTLAKTKRQLCSRRETDPPLLKRTYRYPVSAAPQSLPSHPVLSRTTWSTHFPPLYLPRNHTQTQVRTVLVNGLKIHLSPHCLFPATKSLSHVLIQIRVDLLQVSLKSSIVFLLCFFHNRRLFRNPLWCTACGAECGAAAAFKYLHSLFVIFSLCAV